MVWAPHQRIRVLVLGLARQGERYLLAEVRRDDGTLKGLRPLGGEVEFGETREAAIHREFREELGADATLRGPWVTLENLFEHEGVRGHEIVLVAPVSLDGLPDGDADGAYVFEDGGAICRARWLALESLAAAGLDLYPVGLADAIANGAFDTDRRPRTSR